MTETKVEYPVHSYSQWAAVSMTTDNSNCLITDNKTERKHIHTLSNKDKLSIGAK